MLPKQIRASCDPLFIVLINKINVTHIFCASPITFCFEFSVGNQSQFALISYRSAAAMEVERFASDSENVAVDDNEKPVADEGAGDAATSHSERLRRKNKKYWRSNSKEAPANAAASAVTPLPKYRSWKNSRRPRNGHGRGLPKKGRRHHALHSTLLPSQIIPTGCISCFETSRKCYLPTP